MKKIKKGDIVVRKSYGKDIIFYVKRIVKTSKEDIAIICGLFERIPLFTIRMVRMYWNITFGLPSGRLCSIRVNSARIKMPRHTSC